MRGSPFAPLSGTASGGIASFLLRGRDLSEAEAWLAQQASHREQATQLQTEFIVASRRGAARRQRVAFTGVVVALAVSLVLGIVALLQRNDAIEQSNVSRSRELAASALAQLPTDPGVSLLLAQEAVRVRETPQAEDALRRSLRESHLRLIIAAAKAPAYVPSGAEFSPDGTRILTVGASLARSWDARTGSLLRTVPCAGKPHDERSFRHERQARRYHGRRRRRARLGRQDGQAHRDPPRASRSFHRRGVQP